jgi:hypothetical protein
MRLDEQTQPKQIYVDMGNVLFPSSSNDEVQKGTTERPKDTKGFQTWVINTKQDNQILGRYGADGKWGKNTSNAWIKYGEEYKKSNPNSTTQATGQSNFIGADLWNGIKQYNPFILTSTGSGSGGELKKQTKLKQITDILGLPSDRAIFVTNGVDKAAYAKKNKNNILIDDSDDNITAWNNAGGTGIKHMNNQQTLQTINSLMNPTA